MVHKGLQSVGVSGLLLQLFTDYIHNRKQRVDLPGANSDRTFVNSGVPQGSILSLLLFLLYTNDIVETLTHL